MVSGISGTASLFGGAVVLGLIHGAEPGHGWPVAATYALDRSHKWFHAVAASTLLGLGHLVSSIAVVAVFFLAKDYFGLTQLGWIRYVAGVLLIGLGIREYRHGHSHDHGLDGADDEPDETPSIDKFDDHDQGGHDHDLGGHSHSHDHDVHSHGDHDHHGHEDGARGWWGRLKGALPFVGGGHDHAHLTTDEVDTAGLWSIVGTAFVLGFAHEEEFEIIGMCMGSTLCLELMLVYAMAVLLALVALTLLLVAGFERYEERVARYADYLPTVSAVVLIAIGVGFILGVI
jgi:ABC-type nickel/cobalt efflux system permease component RcnA